MDRRNFLKSIGAAAVVPSVLGALPKYPTGGIVAVDSEIPLLKPHIETTIPPIRPGGTIKVFAESNIEQGAFVCFTPSGTVRAVRSWMEDLIIGVSKRNYKKGEAALIRIAG